MLYKIYEGGYETRDKADIFKYYDDATYYIKIIKECPNWCLKILISDEVPLGCEDHFDMMNHWKSRAILPFFNSSRWLILFIGILRFIWDNYFFVFYFFTLLGFLGQFIMFNFFRHYNYKWALFILFEPSYSFWTSGCLKESLYSIFFSMLIVGTLKMWEFPYYFKNKRRRIFWGILLCLTGLAGLLLRFHITFCLIASILIRWLSRSTNWKKLFMYYAFFFFSGILLVSFFPSFFNIIKDTREKFIQLGILEGSGSLYSTYGFNKPVDLIIYSLWALLNATIRPLYFLIENKVRLLASIENLVITALLLYNIIKYLKSFLWGWRLTLPLMFFVIYSLLVIGIIVPIEGALIRYKSILFSVIIGVICIIRRISVDKKHFNFN